MAPAGGPAKHANHGLTDPDLGGVRRVSSDRIRSVLDWQPRSLEEMTVSIGETMIHQGIVSQ